jgi:ubiquinone biosynthesis accessory factor UbiK
MGPGKIFEGLGKRVKEASESSPAREIEKNARALMSGVLARLDVVSRDEFEIQATLLLRTREKVEALEARVAALEKIVGAPGS